MARCEGRCGRKGTKPTSGGGCEGKAKGGRVGRGDGDPELRKPTEAEEGYGVDASAGTGAHTGANTVRGSQGGAGGLRGLGRSGSGCAKRLERLQALSLVRAGAAGCLWGGRGRASGAGGAVAWLRQGAGECSRGTGADPYEREGSQREGYAVFDGWLVAQYERLMLRALQRSRRR